MFPIPWNFPIIKKNGQRSTIGSEIDSASATYTLPTASASVKGGVKIGSGLQMTGEVLSADSSGGMLYTNTATSPVKFTSSDDAITLTKDAVVEFRNSGTNYLAATLNDTVSYNIPGSISVITILPAGTKIKVSNSSLSGSIAYLDS